MLQSVTLPNGILNDLSPELQKRLEAQIDSFGNVVRFKFDIANPDPDPEKKATGAVIYPFLWTLDPVVFNIIDKEEKREGKGKSKKIGIVDEWTNNDKEGLSVKYRRIRVPSVNMGIQTYDLTKTEDRENVCYLLIHPKLSGGEFADATKRPIITRIDEQSAATEQRLLRTARKKAMDVAEEMSDKDIIDFCDAMSGGNNVEWDSSQDMGVLRNKVEALAEADPKYFNDKVEGKNVEYQALIKQAMNKKVISFNPAEHNFIWVGNNQVVASLSPASQKNEIEQLADIFQTGGAKMEETYKKVKSLVG